MRSRESCCAFGTRKLLCQCWGWKKKPEGTPIEQTQRLILKLVFVIQYILSLRYVETSFYFEVKQD